MKILVIGGTGKVGAEVVKELQKRKADIRLLVRNDGTPAPRGADPQALYEKEMVRATMYGGTWDRLLL
jgi:uncharacterized protein YbjT (DUF2867 family)